MKYVLVLYLCITGQTCIEEKIVPVEYPKYYDCLSDGYIRAYNSIQTLGVDVIEKNKFIVKFECKGVKVENI